MGLERVYFTDNEMLLSYKRELVSIMCCRDEQIHNKPALKGCKAQLPICRDAKRNPYNCELLTQNLM